MRPAWARTALLGAVLALPPLAIQLAGPVPRLDSDAVEYYAHLRSLYFDRDLEFTNEFAHFGILERGDKRVPTATGHRRTIFSVGPALLWMPFYAAGDVLARMTGEVEDGYSPWHIRAVGVGSLAWAVLGLLLLDRVLRGIVPPASAAATVLALLYATFLLWYVTVEAAMSHALSFGIAATVLALWWDGRARPTALRFALLGLAIGVAATVRWQNGVLLLLPAISLLPGLRPEPRRTVGISALVLGAFALGALPQMLAWKAIFGQYLLADPPHGRDFLRLDHPYLLQTFFSSRHGLLYWTPILWGALGLFAFWRRERWAGTAVIGAAAVMGYVNACSGDWWAGGSFSNRRFDSTLPLLALGLACALEAVRARAARQPRLVIAGAFALLGLWNALFMEQFRRNAFPRDATVAFADVAGNNAAILAETVGSPLAWPANWVFAAQTGLPAARYDAAVGKYLFYRQNNLGGVIEVGAADPRGDLALLAEGWSVRRVCAQAVCRQIEGGEARLLAPLDVPEDLQVVVAVEGRGRLYLTVNGRRSGEWIIPATLSEIGVVVPASAWRRELNDVRLAVSAGGTASVDRVSFRRTSR